MKKDDRINELNKKGYKLIGFDNNFIKYEDNDGYKYIKDIYKKGELNNFHKYDIKNSYCIYNINLSLSKNNEYNTKLIPESYKGGKYIAHFKCGRCGKIFKGLIGNILKYKYKICSDCVREIQNTKIVEYEKIKKEVENYGYKLLSKEWNGNHQRIDVKDCMGYKGRIKLETLRNGGSFSKFALYNPYSLENLKLYCKINNFDCSIPNQKFKGYGNNLKVKCSCGKIFEVSLDHFIYDNQIKCRNCSNKDISSYEKKVKEWLDENKVKYIQQYKYNDCKYKKLLPFDFFIIDKNCLIEIQGEQHYYPIKKFGGEKAFKELKKRDSVKYNYCKNKKIPLYYITYIDIKNKNYEKILNKIINS